MWNSNIAPWMYVWKNLTFFNCILHLFLHYSQYHHFQPWSSSFLSQLSNYPHATIISITRNRAIKPCRSYWCMAAIGCKTSQFNFLSCHRGNCMSNTDFLLHFISKDNVHGGSNLLIFCGRASYITPTATSLYPCKQKLWGNMTPQSSRKPRWHVVQLRCRHR